MKMSTSYILSVETSCDETSISVLESSDKGVAILSNVVSSQIELHSKWGGVVPNLAAREHVKNMPSILNEALSKAKIGLSDLGLLSVTSGPGLIPALLVGVNFAKTLSYLLEKPLIGIHHIEGHIYANFITDKISISSKLQVPSSKQTTNHKLQTTDILFPALVLVVSGGHTQLVLMKEHLQYEIVGQTLDDAVGEAFDKVARILDLGYPGGPIVSAKAETTSDKKYEIKLPRPMINSKNFDFSFSGLKTAVLYETKKNPELLKDDNYVSAICREFQQASIDVLVSKTLKAAQEYGAQTIMLAGGVSANKELRRQLGEAIEATLPTTHYSIPPINLTGDNAGMIGAAAHFRWQKMNAEEKAEAKNTWKTLQANANLKLK